MRKNMSLLILISILVTSTDASAQTFANQPVTTAIWTQS